MSHYPGHNYESEVGQDIIVGLDESLLLNNKTFWICLY
jgi:hypothetical protein